MVRGFDASASALTALQRVQQQLANNVSNAETPGFKESLAELMAYPTQNIFQSDYQTGSMGRKVGTIGTGVLLQENVLNFSQGQMKQTGRNLDVSIADTTPQGNVAAVWTNPAAATGAAGAGTTGAAGANGAAGASATASAQSPLQTPGVNLANGPVTAGANGRLEINGQPLALMNANGQAVPGLFAVVNPAYQGTNLIGADGKPVADAKGNPSYFLADAKGREVGQVGDRAWNNVGLLTGSSDTVGMHSFFPAENTDAEGQTSIVLTKDGHLSLNDSNVLIDSAGNPVLPIGSNGLPIQGGRIVVNPNFTGNALFNNDGSATVDSNGQSSYQVLDANGQAVTGKLGTVDAAPFELQPLGQAEYIVGKSLNPGQEMQVLRPGSGVLQIGQLEQSNVNITDAMAKMISVMNSYDANQRALMMQDAEDARDATDIGKVNI